MKMLIRAAYSVIAILIFALTAGLPVQAQKRIEDRFALTHHEMAEKLSAALGRRIQFVDVPPEAMRGALAAAGVPDWQADGLIEDYAHYARREASEVATGVQDATGKPPRSFNDFAGDYAPAFS